MGLEVPLAEASLFSTPHRRNTLPILLVGLGWRDVSVHPWSG